MTLAKDSSLLAKRFIDASIKQQSRPPSKAAYTRAVKMARQAIEELSQLADRLRQ